MGRLPYLSAEDLPQDRRRLLDRPINLFRALAHNPAVLEWMAGLGAWIRHECPLDARLRELAILQVGYLADSPYEFTHHVEISRTFGVVERDVESIAAHDRGEATNLDEDAVLVLDVARQLTEGTTLDDVLWGHLSARFSESEILDLIFVVTHYVQVVRVLGALQIDVEPEYEPYRRLLCPFERPSGEG